MAPSRDIHDPGGVSALIQKLPPGFASLIEAIRQTILSVDPEVGEQIKWNSPSFFYKGQITKERRLEKSDCRLAFIGRKIK